MLYVRAVPDFPFVYLNHGPLDPFIREAGLIPAYRLLAEVCDRLGERKAAEQARSEVARLTRMNEQRDGPFGDGGPKRDGPPPKKN